MKHMDELSLNTMELVKIIKTIYRVISATSKNLKNKSQGGGKKFMPIPFSEAAILTYKYFSESD